MAAFQDTREQTEKKVMVHLLSEIERNPTFTQRGLAGELGIALGLMNQYLKCCITKGWVRASQISPRRITYFLTSDGFKEKSHMVTDYLARSLSFFRDARMQCEEALADCQKFGWTNIALIGQGDLADIARLVAHSMGIHVKITATDADFSAFDAVLITDVVNPQQSYDAVKNNVEYRRLLVLNLLHISKVAP